MADIKDTVASHISTNWNVAVTGGSGSVPTVDAVGPEDILKPEDYPEAVLVYNERVTYDRTYSQGSYGDRHTRVYILLTAHTKSGCTKTHFRAFIDELKSVFGSAISGFDLQILDPEENVTQTKGVQGGMYQASFVLHLWEYGVSTSSAASGGSAGTTYWAEPFVTTSASANLTNETVLSTKLLAYDNDIIPDADSSRDLGSATKYWAEAYIDAITTTGNITCGGNVSMTDLTVTGSVTGLEDADIPDTITLTNITQITTRSHTSLTDIGTNTHAQIDTHIADTSDPHGTIPDTIANVLTDHDKAAHDALALSHDSLSDVSADDHHAESHTFPSHSDISATLSGAELEDVIMYGSANACYVPCMFSQHNNNLMYTNIGGWRFVNTGTKYARFHLPLPTIKNGLKLYVDGWRIVLSDADGGDYVDQIIVCGNDSSTGTTLDTNAGNLDSVDTHTDSFTAIDCSSYFRITIELKCNVTTATDLDISDVSAHCYYGE